MCVVVASARPGCLSGTAAVIQRRMGKEEQLPYTKEEQSKGVVVAARWVAEQGTEEEEEDLPSRLGR